ncbi:MAG: iron-sulfur protein [Clostridiales bacterium]|nr:iron-sulfur protein [Clostridiales bacterium]
MHILVINGSPKGPYSVTLQTVEYLRIKFPEHQFDVLNAAQRIRGLKKDFAPAKAALEQCDAVLFSYPVYTFMAPSQLHEFIALMKQENVQLAGKFVSQITTSKHFYDVTAHRYVQDNVQDMGMKYVHGLSADMDDLTKAEGRRDAEDFFRHFVWCAKNDVFESVQRGQAPVPSVLASLPEKEKEAVKGDVVIVTDAGEEDVSLCRMIDRFRAVLGRKTRLINLRDFAFAGGCLGCFKCAVSGKCVHRDGFDNFLRREIQQAEATVYAFTVRDHSMGPLFKTYDDRQFCNGHRTVTMGMPYGYLVSGPYAGEYNLRQVVESRAQVGGNVLCGVATDEWDPDTQIDRMAAEMNYALDNKYVPPRNFLGVGGMKVFRDLIWLMQGMMKADHKFYKAHGQYDFPQKQWPTMLKMYLVGALISSPKIMSKAGNAMNEGMIAPYKKVLEQAKKETESK